MNPHSEIELFQQRLRKEKQLLIRNIYCPYKAAKFYIKPVVIPLEVRSPFHLRKVFYILV